MARWRRVSQNPCRLPWSRCHATRIMLVVGRSIGSASRACSYAPSENSRPRNRSDTSASAATNSSSRQ